MVQRLGMLDLGDDRLGAAVGADGGLEGLHIRSPAHEALGEKVHLLLHAPADVLQILGREGIEGHIQSQGRHALAGLQQTAPQHLDPQQLAARLHHLQLQVAVIHQPGLAWARTLEEFRVGQRHRPGMALGCVLTFREQRAQSPRHQFDGRLEAAHPPFGALEVQEHRDAAPEGFRSLPDQPQHRGSLLGRGVAGIDAKSVRMHQNFAQRPTFQERGTYRDHQLGLAHDFLHPLHRYSTGFSAGREADPRKIWVSGAFQECYLDRPP
ncbi:MAG: hypothetical protein BWY56_00725 [Acidobacteria bacterium ADurb.Bin340]|nr:MAG: hypothetical protein BWY56_00725 [Acidobacteria bacterium ADurb.Bin340]